MGSPWELARKRVTRPNCPSLRYSLHEGVGRPPWTQKRSLLYVLSCSLCPQDLTASRHVTHKPNSSSMAPRAPDPRLRWLRRRDPPLGPVLSNTRHTNSNILFRRKHVYPSITHHIPKYSRALSACATNPPTRNALPSA
jgi:hypothetical protein